MTNTRKGFTLIETFVAITILVIAIVGPLTIASRGLNSTLLSRDQLTATYLAQEAIEQVRQFKDSNVLQGNDWMSGPVSSCLGANGCYIDVWGATTVAACTGACPNLRYDNTMKLYRHDVGTLTSFRRTVRVENVSTHEKIISVQVDWQSGNTAKSIEIKERIFDWAGGIVTDQTP